MDSIGTRIRRWYEDAPAPMSWLFILIFIGFWVLFVGFVGASLNKGFGVAASDLPQEALRVGTKLGGLYVVLLVIYLIFRAAGFNKNHWKQVNSEFKKNRGRKL